MVAHRLSPSGAFIVTDRLRWYGEEPDDSASEQTGALVRAELDFEEADDPVTELEDIRESTIAVQGEPYSIGRIIVQRLVGEPSGGSNPTGDADIVFQLQRFKQSTPTAQTDVGDPITFAPDEFGKKFAQFGGLIPADEFLFMRATYPDNWVQGDKAIQNFVVAELIA